MSPDSPRCEYEQCEARQVILRLPNQPSLKTRIEPRLSGGHGRASISNYEKENAVFNAKVIVNPPIDFQLTQANLNAAKNSSVLLNSAGLNRRINRRKSDTALCGMINPPAISRPSRKSFDPSPRSRKIVQFHGITAQKLVEARNPAISSFVDSNTVSIDTVNLNGGSVVGGGNLNSCTTPNFNSCTNCVSASTIHGLACQSNNSNVVSFKDIGIHSTMSVATLQSHQSAKTLQSHQSTKSLKSQQSEKTLIDSFAKHNSKGDESFQTVHCTMQQQEETATRETTTSVIQPVIQPLSEKSSLWSKTPLLKLDYRSGSKSVLIPGPKLTDIATGAFRAGSPVNLIPTAGSPEFGINLRGLEQGFNCRDVKVGMHRLASHSRANDPADRGVASILHNSPSTVPGARDKIICGHDNNSPVNFDAEDPERFDWEKDHQEKLDIPTDSVHHSGNPESVSGKTENQLDVAKSEAVEMKNYGGVINLMSSNEGIACNLPMNSISSMVPLASNRQSETTPCTVGGFGKPGLISPNDNVVDHSNRQTPLDPIEEKPLANSDSKPRVSFEALKTSGKTGYIQLLFETGNRDYNLDSTATPSAVSQPVPNRKASNLSSAVRKAAPAASQRNAVPNAKNAAHPKNSAPQQLKKASAAGSAQPKRRGPGGTRGSDKNSRRGSIENREEVIRIYGQGPVVVIDQGMGVVAPSQTTVTANVVGPAKVVSAKAVVPPAKAKAKSETTFASTKAAGGTKAKLKRKKVRNPIEPTVGPKNCNENPLRMVAMDQHEFHIQSQRSVQEITSLRESDGDGKDINSIGDGKRTTSNKLTPRKYTPLVLAKSDSAFARAANNINESTARVTDAIDKTKQSIKVDDEGFFDRKSLEKRHDMLDRMRGASLKGSPISDEEIRKYTTMDPTFYTTTDQEITMKRANAGTITNSKYATIGHGDAAVPLGGATTGLDAILPPGIAGIVRNAVSEGQLRHVPRLGAAPNSSVHEINLREKDRRLSVHISDASRLLDESKDEPSKPLNESKEDVESKPPNESKEDVKTLDYSSIVSEIEPESNHMSEIHQMSEIHHASDDSPASEFDVDVGLGGLDVLAGEFHYQMGEKEEKYEKQKEQYEKQEDDPGENRSNARNPILPAKKTAKQKRTLNKKDTKLRRSSNDRSSNDRSSNDFVEDNPNQTGSSTDFPQEIVNGPVCQFDPNVVTNIAKPYVAKARPNIDRFVRRTSPSNKTGSRRPPSSLDRDTFQKLGWTPQRSEKNKQTKMKTVGKYRKSPRISSRQSPRMGTRPIPKVTGRVAAAKIRATLEETRGTTHGDMSKNLVIQKTRGTPIKRVSVKRMELSKMNSLERETREPREGEGLEEEDKKAMDEEPSMKDTASADILFMRQTREIVDPNDVSSASDVASENENVQIAMVTRETTGEDLHRPAEQGTHLIPNQDTESHRIRDFTPEEPTLYDLVHSLMDMVDTLNKECENLTALNIEKQIQNNDLEIKVKKLEEGSLQIEKTVEINPQTDKNRLLLVLREMLKKSMFSLRGSHATIIQMLWFLREHPSLQVETLGNLQTQERMVESLCERFKGVQREYQTVLNWGLNVEAMRQVGMENVAGGNQSGKFGPEILSPVGHAVLASYFGVARNRAGNKNSQQNGPQADVGGCDMEI